MVVFHKTWIISDILFSPVSYHRILNCFLKLLLFRSVIIIHICYLAIFKKNVILILLFSVTPPNQVNAHLLNFAVRKIKHSSKYQNICANETSGNSWQRIVDCVGNVMLHAQKPDFVFRGNGQVHLNRRGCQFSRLLAAEVCVVMLDTQCSEVVWRLLATHSIRQFPLHFPSRVSPCSITFELDSTTC